MVKWPEGDFLSPLLVERNYAHHNRIAAACLFLRFQKETSMKSEHGDTSAPSERSSQPPIGKTMRESSFEGL